MARRILILGDSTSMDPPWLVGQSSWPAYFRNLTKRESLGLRGNVHIDDPWEVFSAADVGATMQSQTLVAASFSGRGYDTAIVLCGRHDLDVDEVSLAILQARALALYAALNAGGVREVIACEIPPSDDLRHEVERRGFNAWLRATTPANVARVARVSDQLSDSVRWWKLDNDFDSGDGVHLSARGAEALAGMLLSVLLRLDGPWAKGHNAYPSVQTFAPTEIDDCINWLRGDLGVTLTAGKVSAWADQSGRGNHVAQAVAGSRPTIGALGGKDAVLFAVPEFLSGAFTGLPACADFTNFIVARITSLADAVSLLRTAHQIDDGGVDHNGHSFWWVFPAIPPLGDKLIDFRSQEGWPAPSSDLGYAYSSLVEHHIWTCLHNGWGRSILEDGDVELSNMPALAGNHPPAPIVQAVGARTDGLYTWVGEIAEIISYARCLDLYELAVIHRYLGARYGLAVST